MPLKFLTWNSHPLDFSRILVTVILISIIVIILIVIVITRLKYSREMKKKEKKNKHKYKKMYNTHIIHITDPLVTLSYIPNMSFIFHF